MSKAIATRLERLESRHVDKNTPRWLAIRKWLGEPLSADQEAELAAWEAEQPLFDPLAPIDTRGWSDEDRRWLGFRGPGQEYHVPEPPSN